MRILLWPLRGVQLLLQSICIASAQIWANKVRSILTTIGIVIGVASVTAVIAALTGLKENVLKDFESFGTNKIYISPKRPKAGPHRFASWRVIRFMPKQFEGLLDHCPAIRTFTRICGGPNRTIQYREHTSEAQMQGIEPAWHEIENRSVVLGRPFSHMDEAAGRNVCIITERLRDRLRLDTDCIGQRVFADNRSFVIVGVVEPPAEMAVIELGERSDELYIPFQTFWKLYRGWIFAIALARSPEQAEDGQAELRFFLRQRRGLRPGEPDTFGVEPIQQYIEKFKAIAAMVTVIAGGIVGVSLVVGGVGIMNIMLVSVSERTREIGLRKAVGAPSSAILLQFLVEAVVLCLLGGLVGLLSGQALTSAMAKIPQAKLTHASIPVWAIWLSFGFSAAVGVLFGMFPAIKAARLNPIDALRHE